MVEQTPLVAEIKKELLDQTVPVAVLDLKKKWLKIGAVMSVHGEPPVALPGNVSDEDITSYTKEFIEKRQADITLADGTKKTITLQNIDTAILRYNASEPNADQPLISNELPNLRTIEKTAEATARGAESQMGWGNQIMSFIMGLFQWIAAMFSPPDEKGNRPGLWECVAQAAAPRVGNSISHELNQEAATDPAVARYLRYQTGGVSVGDLIVSQGMDKARAYTTGQPVTPSIELPAMESLANVKMENPGLPSNDDIRKKISDLIITEGQVYATAYDELKKMRTQEVAKAGTFWGTVGKFTGSVPTDQQLQDSAYKATSLIADTISQAVADPTAKAKNGKKIAELSCDEFGQEMADRIIVQAEKNKAKLGIDQTMFTGNPKTGKRPIDELRPSLATAVADQHHKLQQAMSVVQLNEQKRVAEAAKTEPAKNTSASAQAQNGFVPTTGLPTLNNERGIV